MKFEYPLNIHDYSCLIQIQITYFIFLVKLSTNFISMKEYIKQSHNIQFTCTQPLQPMHLVSLILKMKTCPTGYIRPLLRFNLAKSEISISIRFKGCSLKCSTSLNIILYISCGKNVLVFGTYDQCILRGLFQSVVFDLVLNCVMAILQKTALYPFLLSNKAANYFPKMQPHIITTLND